MGAEGELIEPSRQNCANQRSNYRNPKIEVVVSANTFIRTHNIIYGCNLDIFEMRILMEAFQYIDLALEYGITFVCSF